MAITVTNKTIIASGPKRVVYATITLDSSYNTGGEAVAAADLGLSIVDDVFCSLTSTGYAVDYVGGTTLTFKAYGTGTASGTASVSVAQFGQVGQGIDLSAESFGIIAVGI